MSKYKIWHLDSDNYPENKGVEKYIAVSEDCEKELTLSTTLEECEKWIAKHNK